jgi:hypothetical protein
MCANARISGALFCRCPVHDVLGSQSVHSTSPRTSDACNAASMQRRSQNRRRPGDPWRVGAALNTSVAMYRLHSMIFFVGSTRCSDSLKDQIHSWVEQEILGSLTATGLFRLGLL